MGIKRYVADADNTITNAFRQNLSDRGTKGNMGQSDILEIYSIYAQQSNASVEKSRILIKFPIDKIYNDRQLNKIPKKGKTSFYLKLFNAKHSQTVPLNYSLLVAPVAQSWSEGYGIDMEEFLNEGASNWLSASDTKIPQVVYAKIVSTAKAGLNNGYLSLYNASKSRYNFWFKVDVNDAAPSLDGAEVEVDLTALNADEPSNPTNIATILKDAINGTGNSYGFSATRLAADTSKLSIVNTQGGATQAPYENVESTALTAHIHITGSSASGWNSEGGDYHSDKTITIPGVNPTGTITIVDLGGNTTDRNNLHGTSGFTISDGTNTIEYYFDKNAAAGVTGTSTADGIQIGIQNMSAASDVAAQVENAINSANGHGTAGHDTVTVSRTDNVVSLSNDTQSEAGNIDIDVGSTPTPTYITYTGLSGGEPPRSPVYTTYISAAEDDVSIDITNLVEDWILDASSSSTFASAIFDFQDQVVDAGVIELYSFEGRKITYEFDTSGLINNGAIMDNGNTCIVSGDAATSAANFILSVTGKNGHKSKFTAESVTATQIRLTQAEKGYHGNTLINTNVPSSDIIVPASFTSGGGAPNYGVGVMLSGSYEDGSDRRSYYTKKFFARGSEFFLDRPALDAIWDSSIADDRNNFYKSSRLLDTDENTNKIYLYNYAKGQLRDIPRLSSSASPTLSVHLYSALGANALGTHEQSMVLGTRTSTGIYEASVIYSGSSTILYDVWSTGSTPGAAADLRIDELYTEFATGSAINVKTAQNKAYYPDSNYVTSITNLKSDYKQDEVAIFRVHTKNKRWNKNIYTKATSKLQTDVIEQAYYSIARLADSKVVIPYSTGSIEYSKMSYDVSGSFFMLDMSILEPYYAYEVSFLYKINDTYELQENTFKFRVS